VNGSEQHEEDNTHHDDPAAANAEMKEPINNLEDKVEFEIYHI